MKNVTTKSIILFFILCFSSQLPILAQGNPKQTKYTIKNAWWTDKIDNDKDGYPHKSKLHFDVDVSSGQHTVYAKIFYKPSSSNSYALYYTTPTFTITGKNNSDAVGVVVGEPNVQLRYGKYDFKIQIYEFGSKKISATWSPSNDWDLKDQKFESFGYDKPSPGYRILSAKFKNIQDKDNDGYASFSELFITVNSYKSVPKVSNTKILLGVLIYYKTRSANTYTLYNFPRFFWFFDGSSFHTVYSQAIGTIALSRNRYDFKIVIFETEDQRKKILSIFDHLSNESIKDKGFEKISEDVISTYTISDAWWSSTQDKNSNGYNSYRKLHFNVEAINGGAHDMYAKIFYTSPTNSSKLYYTTPSFTITGNKKSDAYWIAVGSPHIQLKHNLYDFKIQIFKNDGSKIVRATLDPTDDSDLKNNKFEKISEDEVAVNISTYKISGTWWTDAKDRDSDGYTRYRRLHFNVDVSSGTQNVFAKIYYKTSSSNSYTLYYTTPTFPITGNKKSDNYWIAVGKPHTQPPHNIYDFKIEVYAPGSNKLLVTKESKNDNDLGNNKFEKFSEDPFSN